MSFIGVFFLLITVCILLLGLFVTKSNAIVSIMGALILITLVVLDVKAPRIANLSKDDPKVKTIRTINRMTIFIITLICVIIVLSPKELDLIMEDNEVIVVELISLFMMISGNLSPKIPFNRY